MVDWGPIDWGQNRLGRIDWVQNALSHQAVAPIERERSVFIQLGCGANWSRLALWKARD